MRSDSIQFRPARVEDQDFLYKVYASTRSDIEIMCLGSTEKSKLLQMQFAAQKHSYKASFPNASFLIIMLSNVPVGRFYVNRPGEEILIIDIALLPEYRGQGIGSRLMTGIFEEASNTNLSVYLTVAIDNTAAFHWYESLGFEKVEDLQTHFRMRWQPGLSSSHLDHPSQ